MTNYVGKVSTCNNFFLKSYKPPFSITNQEDARKESIEAETVPRDPVVVDKLVRVEHAVKKAVEKCTEILNRLQVCILRSVNFSLKTY